MFQLEEVVKYVIYKCREEGKPVTEALAAFVAQTIINPKTKRFYAEDKISESELNFLKEETLVRLTDQVAINLKTIQMQISFDMQFYENELKRQEPLKQQSIETGRLIDDVVTLEIKNAKDFEGLTLLYKKIFNFLLYKNKELILDLPALSNNTVALFNIEKEVAAALESVIPRAALGPFVSLNPSEKVTQLVELSNLVIGIRLFNKKLGKGGASLSSLQELIEHQGRNLPELIRREATEASDQCENYTLFFMYHEDMGHNFHKNSIEAYKNELTFLRQYLSYLLSLQEDVENSENTIETNEARYTKEINELRNLLGNKSSAPKEQVYPKFATLSQAYVQLLEEKKISENRLKLMDLLLEHKSRFNLTLQPSLIKEAKVLHAESQMKEKIIPEVEVDPASEVIRLLPHTTPDFMQTPLDFLGFCVWSIVNRGGLLIPGKPNLGVFIFRDKHCVFSDEKAIVEFLTKPDKFMLGIVEKCRENPELIHLLRMEDQFKNLQLSPFGASETGLGLSTKLMVDKGVNTPTHFIEKNYDANYCWNVWELRNKAIQMANIRKRQTRAFQTILSNFKVDSEAQVWLKKDQGTNPGISVGTNPVRPRNYITGLRDKNNQLKF